MGESTNNPLDWIFALGGIALVIACLGAVGDMVRQMPRLALYLPVYIMANVVYLAKRKGLDHMARAFGIVGLWLLSMPVGWSLYGMADSGVYDDYDWFVIPYANACVVLFLIVAVTGGGLLGGRWTKEEDSVDLD